jgi:hypothetical protein
MNMITEFKEMWIENEKFVNHPEHKRLTALYEETMVIYHQYNQQASMLTATTGQDILTTGNQNLFRFKDEMTGNINSFLRIVQIKSNGLSTQEPPDKWVRPGAVSPRPKRAVYINADLTRSKGRRH